MARPHFVSSRRRCCQLLLSFKSIVVSSRPSQASCVVASGCPSPPPAWMSFPLSASTAGCSARPCRLSRERRVRRASSKRAASSSALRRAERWSSRASINERKACWTLLSYLECSWLNPYHRVSRKVSAPLYGKWCHACATNARPRSGHGHGLKPTDFRADPSPSSVRLSSNCEERPHLDHRPTAGLRGSREWHLCSVTTDRSDAGSPSAERSPADRNHSGCFSRCDPGGCFPTGQSPRTALPLPSGTTFSGLVRPCSPEQMASTMSGCSSWPPCPLITVTRIRAGCH
jgi:hypothetical protein